MFEQRTALLERTIELLRNRPEGLTLKKIAEDTSLTVAWLTYLLTEKNKETKTAPSVVRIQTLYEYLTQGRLELR